MTPYYNISMKIELGVILLTVATTITISSSIESFTDTAKITLPREFSTGDISIEKKKLLDKIKVGDRVSIYLGYDNEIEKEFEGYITKIGADIPLEIECEDEMYKLKRMPQVNATYKEVSLPKLLKNLLPNYSIEALDISLGKFTVERATPYKVIEELKKQYGISCYFKNGVLYAGLAIDIKPGESHSFTFGRNIRKTDSLKYVTKESKTLYIKAESMQRGGEKKKVVYEYGDRGGNEITLHAPIGLSLSELKKFTEQTHKNRVFDGYDGSLDTWGIPKTKVGDVAKLTDPNYPDAHRDMSLFIAGVDIEVSDSTGFLRKNKLAFKI